MHKVDIFVQLLKKMKTSWIRYNNNFISSWYIELKFICMTDYHTVADKGFLKWRVPTPMEGNLLFSQISPKTVRQWENLSWDGGRAPTAAPKYADAL